ncbi:hypothetical protein C1646_755618 [Rhizophagus diaphanus]|nr:hypothetical protein C1646_755618 [Rhizophagus diaphanus] [Rhizophagus sp. MUCL 43196]
MWDLLDTSDREILANFVRACSLLVCRIIATNALREAHSRLLQVARLIETYYGKEMITPNIYLSLHIVDCCHDYGSLYSFWPTTGSLVAYDGFDFAELYRFMQTFHQNIDVTITGCEEFSGEMITPEKQVSLPDTIYELLIKYYNVTYNRNFISIAEFVSNNLTSSNSENQPIVVSPNMSQFGRIRIATEIFGSALAPQYQRSSYVTSKFIQDDESVDIFPGQYVGTEGKNKISLQNRQSG